MSVETNLMDLTILPETDSETIAIELPSSGSEDPQVEEKFRRWRPYFAVEDQVMVEQLRQLVGVMVRLERGVTEEEARRRRIMARAKLCWEIDRSADVMAIVAKLPRNPPRWREELLKTSQGCRWIIAEWKQLLHALDQPGGWNPRQRSHALDLLAIHPLHRDAECSLPQPAEGVPVDPKTLILEEIEGLTAIEENQLAPIDAFEREQAMAGLTLSFDRDSQALRRHVAGLQRRFYQLWRMLRPYYRAEAPTPSAAPTPQPRPARSTPNQTQQINSEANIDALARSVRDRTERCSDPMAPVIQSPEPPKSRPTPPTSSGNRRERRRAAALARRGK